MITEKNLKLSVIITAAGKGERAGFGINKLLAPLYGAPALWHTLKKFDMPEIDEVIITSSENDFAEISKLADPFGYKVVIGGETRSASVKAALRHTSGDIVLIHDGARPFVSRELILRCIDGVVRYGSAVAALPATDAMAFSHYGMITGVPDRSSLYRIQTPQGFYTENIKRAYELAGDKSYFDDSSVYCEFAASPKLVEGEESNIKLTYARDFLRELPQILPSEYCRAGFGVDVHSFCKGNGVILAGAKIPCDRALLAHSDGDVVFHAVTDSLLSAAGLKDIGHYFPDWDERYRNADSAHMCATALEEVKKAGYEPLNISVSVQAEKPRLAPYINEMVGNIASTLGLPHNSVALSAGTCEGLGFVGEGLGIAAYSFILLKKSERKCNG